MSRRKRVLVWAGVLVVLTGVGLGVAWRITGPGHGITPENIAKIQEGMTESAAERILGAPAGNYSGGRQHGFGLPVGPGLVRKEWIADRCSIELDFTPDGRVSMKTTRVAPPESWSDVILRWLGF